ncbi:hypothetical protein, partial [Kocuria rosea]|uniref:hypothetical protein n=1 Tax=Kocuria rosea TaxID=1275 RepID=UPI001C92E416
CQRRRTTNHGNASYTVRATVPGLGDDVEVTGTVEKRDVFTIDDLETLQQVTDEETAQYFVNREEELILTDATVTRTD